MSLRARLFKQRIRLGRGPAQGFYDHSWEHREPQRSMHEESNRLAQEANVPEGWMLISHKKRVAFRLPKAGEYFLNSDGQVDRAAYRWEEWAFGHGPRWIVRRRRKHAVDR